MRLKCIRLAGFKSFVDPTTVSFPSNMTAVVGPNGCGKSNIIDAVRWVLGESSAKNLRGEAMTDVIFNGSNTRKPVSQASIELVFDNSAGTLPGEYASYAEISIRRTVTRESQSTYYLNGTKCRRRDITDIFLGTGLGPRSYAIIEQGMISRLIEARPDDLRIFIEEAAGISKYKERRRETESRIRRTQDNLARLSDLRDELGRQIERLHRQAQAAERYQNLQQQLEQYKSQLTAMRWQALAQQGEQLEQLLASQENHLQEHISAQYQADAQTEQLRDQQHELNETFNKIQARFYALGADIARTEQSIQHGQQRLRQLHDDLRDAQRQQQETQAHLAQDQGLLKELTEQQNLLEESYAAACEQDEINQAAFVQAEEQLQEWQEQWQRFNTISSAPKQQAEVERLRIQQLRTNIQQLQQRISNLSNEQEQLVASVAKQTAAELQEQLAMFEEQLAEVALQQEISNEQQHHQRQRIKELQQKRHEQQTQLQRCQGQLSALQALQQDAVQSTDELQDWLSEQQLSQAPRLADVLRVESGWERAVESVLGEDVHALCVAQWPSDFAKLDNAHVRMLKQSSADSEVNPHTLLTKVLSSEVDLSAWLAKVHCAENLDQAWTMLDSLAADASVVTRDGFWLSSHFLRVQLGQDNQQGVLQRAQQLEQLAEHEHMLVQQLEQNTHALEGAQNQLAELEQSAQGLRQQEQCNSTQLSEKKSQLAAIQARAEQLEKRQQQIAEQLQELHEQQAIDHERLAESELLLEQAEQAVADAQGQAQRLQQQQADKRHAYEQARNQAQTSQQQAQQLKLQLSTVITQKHSTEQALERLRVQIERVNQRQEQLGLDLEEGESPIEELRAKLEEQLQQRFAVDEELRGARMAVEETEQQLRQLEKQRHQAQQQAEQVRNEAEKLRLNKLSLEVQQQALSEQLATTGLTVHEVLLGLPSDAAIERWQATTEQLNEQSQRLGAINLAAIEEYRQQSERKNYLDTQNEDLEEALSTLENVIRKIDRETRQRFKETFDKINIGLQDLFPKVFGGGMASLELTGEDLLDTGVAIMARPPGKKNSTIHLLSGGEKALTALALVFAIFQLNPAPFCMLDEVDAPLDDANVGRYARLVKEMSDKVQFIYITHNKIAMEMAHQLLGVTMQEPGCSRMVAVDLAEAAALAEQ